MKRHIAMLRACKLCKYPTIISYYIHKGKEKILCKWKI